jgi:hypothetical protein
MLFLLLFIMFELESLSAVTVSPRIFGDQVSDGDGVQLLEQGSDGFPPDQTHLVIIRHGTLFGARHTFHQVGMTFEQSYDLAQSDAFGLLRQKVTALRAANTCDQLSLFQGPNELFKVFY